MMTNLMWNSIQMLHTTAAYQAAALQLMVSNANFVAKQFDLKEPLPIVAPADTNLWEVEPPPMGVAGSFQSSNYVFRFREGHLTSIHEKGLNRNTNALELAHQSSLVDASGAYQLATQWLAGLSIDVPKLEQKFPPRIYQEPMFVRNSENRWTTNGLMFPVFRIGWGNDPSAKFLLARGITPRPRPPNPLNTVYVYLDGANKELVQFDIRDTSFFKSPPMQVTNADELLGPLPPPQHFVEQMLGGKDAYKTVANPEKVEVWLLNSAYTEAGIVARTNRTSAVTLNPEITKKFSDILTNFDSYYGGAPKNCIPDFGVRLQFTRGNNSVEIFLCLECDILQVTNGTREGNFDPNHNALVKLIQSIFPKDEKIKNLEFR